jgi:hypothetical protein
MGFSPGGFGLRALLRPKNGFALAVWPGGRTGGGAMNFLRRLVRRLGAPLQLAGITTGATGALARALVR